MSDEFDPVDQEEAVEPSGADERARRPPGRPRKGDGPAYPFRELDRLLVFGETAPGDDGAPTTMFPSYRKLAERFGVAVSIVADHAKRFNCLKRREENQRRIVVRADEKIVEQRANQLAVSQEDSIRIIDTYLLGFEKAMGEGVVRFDNPVDFNTMLRLKEFIRGNADSRAEINSSITLDAIRERHAKMLREASEMTPEMTGVVASKALPSSTEQGPPPAELLGDFQPGSERNPEGEPEAEQGDLADRSDFVAETLSDDALGADDDGGESCSESVPESPYEQEPGGDEADGEPCSEFGPADDADGVDAVDADIVESSMAGQDDRSDFDADQDGDWEEP